MRIISGNRRGKKIVVPENLPVRPTTDFAKEGLFNILNNYFHLDAVQVLDLFAGTGNISYEFAARGATSVYSVDNHQNCVNFIYEMSKKLQFQQIIALKSEVIAFLKSCRHQFNIIFADPPYDWNEHSLLPIVVFENELLLKDGFLVIEHPATISYKEHPKFYQQRNYGKVNFSFFAENL